MRKGFYTSSFVLCLYSVVLSPLLRSFFHQIRGTAPLSPLILALTSLVARMIFSSQYLPSDDLSSGSLLSDRFFIVLDLNGDRVFSPLIFSLPIQYSHEKFTSYSIFFIHLIFYLVI